MTTLESTSSTLSTNRLKWSLIGIAALIAFLALLFVFSETLSTNPGAISIKASGLQFNETELHAQVGQPVTLELFNTDGYGHAFDIDEFNIHVELPASKTTTLTFTPTEPGTYMFYCGAYGHKEGGMVGTLVAEP